MIKKMKSIPITLRISLWYTLFIALLLVLLTGLSFFIYNIYSSSLVRNELIQSVNEISQDMDGFVGERNDIYYLLYDEEEILAIRGFLPPGFDEKDVTSLQEVRSQGEFLYYDVELPEGDYFVRGIIDTSNRQSPLRPLFLIVLIISPLILLIALYGGHRIMKNAFRLVENATRTANEIQLEGDFSKRIHLGNGQDEISRMVSSFNGMLDRLESSYEREKQFSSDVSHELRTPISVILSQSQYGLRYGDSLEESKNSLTVIEKQAQRMKLLLNQIMDLSKLDGRITLEKENYNLSRLVNETLEETQWIRPEIQRIRQIEENLMVNGDPSLFSRLLDNLLSNALKFTTSKVEVRLYSKEGKIRLEIIDNGPGISKEDQKKIFNRFYQTDSSRSKGRNPGHGLGLSFVKRIAEIHGYALEVESVQGKGSCFRIII